MNTYRLSMGITVIGARKRGRLLPHYGKGERTARISRQP